MTLPIVISDSDAAPPSELMKPAEETPVFLGIFTLPVKPDSMRAPACMTLEALRSASMKSCPRKSSAIKLASLVVLRSRFQLPSTSGGSMMPCAVVPYWSAAAREHSNSNAASSWARRSCGLASACKARIRLNCLRSELVMPISLDSNARVVPISSRRAPRNSSIDAPSAIAFWAISDLLWRAPNSTI